MAEPLILPTDRKRKNSLTSRGAIRSFELSAELFGRLQRLSQADNVTPFALLLSAWQTLLHRHSSQTEFMVVSPLSRHLQKEEQRSIGACQKTLALRADFSGDPSFREVLQRTRANIRDALAHQDLPFETLLRTISNRDGFVGSPLLRVMFSMKDEPQAELKLNGLIVRPIPVHNSVTSLDLKLALCPSPSLAELHGALEYNADLFDMATIDGIIAQFQTLSSAVADHPEERVSALPLLTNKERHRIVVDWNRSASPCGQRQFIHALIEQQAACTPESPALVFGEQQLTYEELMRRANTLGTELRAQGVGPGVCVGLPSNPSPETTIGILSILKTGAAYVPLDPTWSSERRDAILRESVSAVLLTPIQLSNLPEGPPPNIEKLGTPNRGGVRAPAGKIQLTSGLLMVWINPPSQRKENADPSSAIPDIFPDTLACISHGGPSATQPKGVLLTHANAMEFFDNMDRLLGREPVVWLSAHPAIETRMGWEWLWPLTHGGRIVLHEPAPEVSIQRLSNSGLSITPGSTSTANGTSRLKMDLSLFYFSSQANGNSTERYRLLLEGARFADANNFAAVWTPERHFHAFGALYPSPAVTSAALAMITQRIQIRAGSVVLPLHHPVRVAEEWAMVDNLSGGRVGVSFASGWHANDFIFAPERYPQRQQILFRDIEVVRRLWRGESVPSLDGAGKQVETRILPRPVQSELPFWITSSGRVETFRKAGEAGAGLLTHLIGQTPAELAVKIEVYRAARKQAGHSGRGHVVLMLHTFVGPDPDEVKEKVRTPFTNYLKDSIDLIQGSPIGAEAKDLSPEDLDTVASFAFERYFETSGLFGTPEACSRRVGQLQTIGVDEIACLIDFGVETDSILESLPMLNEVRLRSNGLWNENQVYWGKNASAEGQHSTSKASTGRSFSIAQSVLRHQVTHLQCTAKEAAALLQEPEGTQALVALDKLLLVGDPAPASLLAELHEGLSGELLYLRGQPETSLWFTAYSFTEKGSAEPAGRRLGNSELYILDERFQPVPPRIPGELFVGGPGVASGYRDRPDLESTAFIVHSLGEERSLRLFRTGERARFKHDGTVEFLGRIPRPSLVESILLQHPGVSEAVVITRHRGQESPSIVAFVAPLRSSAESENRGSDDLRRDLEQSLRENGETVDFIFLETLPRMVDGLVNRPALRALLERPSTSTQTITLPGSSTEEAVRRIWREVLGVNALAAQDDFFDQGGHSLQLVQVAARIRETFQIEISLKSLFTARTIPALAALIEKSLRTSIESFRPSVLPRDETFSASHVTAGLPD